MAGARITGLAALERKINRLPQATRDAIRAAIAQSANEIVTMAKSLVPVGNGELLQSIGWTWGKATPKGTTTLGRVVASKLAGDLTATIYAGDDTAFYARWVEFGTAPHTAGGKFKGAQIPGTRARPFFFPSYRSNKKAAQRRIRAAVRKSAQDVAAGR
jgi:HK97 gp10 family phage protein